MLERLAVLAGMFVGAMLKECAPVLAEILAEGIRRAFRDTVEDSMPPDGLADSLRARITERMRKPDDHST